MSATAPQRKSRVRTAAKKGSATRSEGKGPKVDTVSDVRNAASNVLAMPVEADQIKQLIAERPELLEPGLVAYVDGEGRACGVDFETEVGEIDLLARSASGDWLVVMVARSDLAGDAIAGVLQRLGWVQKHLCGVGEVARGILLVDRMDEPTRYSAAALVDSVDFLTWRLSLQFERLSS